MGLSRRAVMGAAVGAPLASCVSGPLARPPAGRCVVVGAGVFGAWTAEHLRRAGADVLLVDQAGPANAQSSSGGESRMTRSAYGADAIYTQMALASLGEWKTLSETEPAPLFHPCGVLFFFDEMVDYAAQSIAVHRDLGLPLEELDAAALSARWPQIDFAGVEFGLFEPAFGALMARRAVAAVVGRFVDRGGAYRLARAEPDPRDGHIVRLNGEPVRADAVVYACGPWLGALFPEILSDRLFVTRQETAYLAPPPGDGGFGPDALPGWADYNGGDLYYGFPDLEARGFKIARDRHGPAFDAGTGDRRMSEAGAADLRAFLARRFPALAERPFSEFRVCQYTNSSNGDLLIDRHPSLDGAFLLGAGSGHGFKHGPEVGRRMAELALGRRDAAEPRFSLAAKATTQDRSVL